MKICDSSSNTHNNNKTKTKNTDFKSSYLYVWNLLSRFNYSFGPVVKTFVSVISSHFKGDPPSL